MRNRRLVRRLIGAALLLLLAPGCLVFRSSRPVSVLAVDAETKKPIPGAAVRIFYPLTPAYRAPAESSGKTGEDGTAVLQAAATDEGLAVDVTAPGFLFEQKRMAADAVPAAEPARPFAPAAKPASAALSWSCTRNPAPRSSWHCRPATAARCKSRSGRATTSPVRRASAASAMRAPSGVVQAVGPALLRRAPDIVASYADGAPLTKQPKDGEIGFLWVKSEGAFDYFVVGTPIERDSLRRSGVREGTSPPPDGGQQAGRGRKGRRGSQPPSDSGADAPNP